MIGVGWTTSEWRPSLLYLSFEYAKSHDQPLAGDPEDDEDLESLRDAGKGTSPSPVSS